jgi:hypothetical protein
MDLKMYARTRLLGIAFLVALLGAAAAKAEGVAISQERQAYLEGV